MDLHTFYNYVFGDTAKVASIPATVTLTAAQEERKKAVCDRKKTEFTFITSNPRLSAAFRKMLRVQNSRDLECLLYGNHTDLLEQTIQHGMPSDEDIKAQFGMLDQEYGYFAADRNAADIFVKLVKACKLIADYVEENNSDDNTVAYLHAYKMMVLFKVEVKNPFNVVDKYIENHGSHYAKPIHDTLVLPIPKNSPPLKHLDAWRKLINRYGVSALSLFQQAPEIERLLEGQEPFIFTLESLQKAAAQITYKQFAINPELAALCLQYHVAEEDFNRCLTIKPKTTDLLPDVMVDGNKVGQRGYYLVKLPVNDPRAFILGHLTNCCQSIGGHSEICVIDGVTRKHNGFYVLLKSKSEAPDQSPLNAQGEIDYDHFELVGQGYAWWSRFDNLVLDSWENLTPDRDDPVIVPMLNKFADQCFEAQPRIGCVKIGVGGKTPRVFKGDEDDSFDFDEVNDGNFEHLEDKMKEGTQYPDSLTQTLIAKNPVLVKHTDALNKRIRQLGIASNVKMLSMKHVTYFHSLLEKNAVAKYQHLLGDHRYRELLELILKEPILLEPVFLCHQADLLNRENASLFMQFKHDSNHGGKYSSDAPYRLQEGVSILHEATPALLNNKNLTVLFQKAGDARGIATALACLYKIKPDLMTDENRALLAQYTRHSSGDMLDKALSAVYEANPDLITDQNFKLLAVNQDIVLAHILIQLHAINPNLINDENRGLLTQNVKYFKELDIALIELHNISSDLVTDENFKLLVQNAEYSGSLSFALTQLHNISSDLVTDKHFKIMIQNAKYSYALIGLHNCSADLVTDENFKLMVQNPQNVDLILGSLGLIHEFNPACIVTSETFKLIADVRSHSRLDSLLHFFHKANPNLITDENIKLALRLKRSLLADVLFDLHRANPNLITDINFKLLVQNEEHHIGILDKLDDIPKPERASITSETLIEWIAEIAANKRLVAPRAVGLFPPLQEHGDTPPTLTKDTSIETDESTVNKGPGVF